jgi:hypothetical protein
MTLTRSGPEIFLHHLPRRLDPSESSQAKKGATTPSSLAPTALAVTDEQNLLVPKLQKKIHKTDHAPVSSCPPFRGSKTIWHFVLEFYLFGTFRVFRKFQPAAHLTLILAGCVHDHHLKAWQRMVQPRIDEATMVWNHSSCLHGPQDPLQVTVTRLEILENKFGYFCLFICHACA